MNPSDRRVRAVAERTTDQTTLDGALAPARRGMTLLRAKRTMEAMIEACRRFVDVPMVKDEEALGRDPAQAGITAAPVIVRLQIRRPGATCAA